LYFSTNLQRLAHVGAAAALRVDLDLLVGLPRLLGEQSASSAHTMRISSGFTNALI
jgi:hypothetical protein